MMYKKLRDNIFPGTSSFRDGQVLVFGHRGARGLAPENTLAGFELAISMGLDGVEFDAMLCGSGEAIVFHDYRLGKLAGGWGWVENASLDKIKQLDVGGMFHPRYRGEKIPTLDEAIDLIGDKMLINIELKGEDATDDGLELKVIDALRRRHLVDNVIVSSFNPVRVSRLREAAGEFVTGILIQRDVAGWLRRFWFAPLGDADAVFSEIGMVSKPIVDKWHLKNKVVVAWPANTQADMRNLIECGVDGIITDRPDRLMKLLGRSDES